MNTTLPPVSAVIPCYKAQDTLRRAVTSLLDGAPDNLQVLLVEDGSPDKTGALCDELAAGDPRIRVIHRPNGGASAARNTGLDAAAGDWVLFLDADDELLPGLWQALPEALKSRPSLILFGMTRASGPAPCPLAPGRYYSPAALGEALDPLLFESGYLAAPYPKLFLMEPIRRTGLRFDETLQINEDVLFNLEFLQILQFSQISSAIYCLPGVYYRQNDMLAGSLSRRLRGDLLDAEETTRPALCRLVQAMNLPPEEQRRLTEKSRVRAALNQYGLLTGCPGPMPLRQRRELFRRILADPAARAALRSRLACDPNRLLALPYRLGVALHLPGWLAVYTKFKNRFLPN